MKQIQAFMHCKTCVLSGRRDRLEVGLTPHGLQVWCKTCDTEVTHATPSQIEQTRSSVAGGRCMCDLCGGLAAGARLKGATEVFPEHATPGRGPYAPEIDLVVERTKAAAVALVVIDGDRGEGFSMAFSEDVPAVRVVNILRRVAEDIEGSVTQTGEVPS